MIYDKIENAARYLGTDPFLDLALRWITEEDLCSMPCGSYPIDGENVFVNIMDAVTDPDRERDYEFHKNHYDIQIDISGRESVLFGTDCHNVTKVWQEDIGFCRCMCEAEVCLSAQRFVVCEPGEPHLPGTATGKEAEKIRKAVIKVRKAQREED